MQLIGLARLGQDAKIRTTQGGDKVANVSLAYNYGRKDADGKRPTQWVEASLWGKRAEALIDYLVKGQAVVVTIDGPHIETFEKRDGGQGIKLAGEITQIELAGRAEGSQQQPRQQAPAQRPAPASDMDDDIPF